MMFRCARIALLFIGARSVTLTAYDELFRLFCVLLHKHGGTVTITPADLDLGAGQEVTLIRQDLPQVGPGAFSLDLEFTPLPTRSI